MGFTIYMREYEIEGGLKLSFISRYELSDEDINYFIREFLHNKDSFSYKKESEKEYTIYI